MNKIMQKIIQNLTTTYSANREHTIWKNVINPLSHSITTSTYYTWIKKIGVIVIVVVVFVCANIIIRE